MRIARTCSPGHPDKACQLIAETIVDEYVRRDPSTRLRIHVTGGKGALFVTGMVSSKADFDVGAIAARTAGALGARNPIEPFVALETIGSSGLPQYLRFSGMVNVAGYATRETPEGMPPHMVLSRRIAKRLEDLRTQNQDWFWLEPGFTVDVTETVAGVRKIIVSCGQGERPLDQVRESVNAALEDMRGTDDVRVNTTGPLSGWSLDHDMGSSGILDASYGSSLPIQVALAGIDFYHPQKFGTWLARSLARVVIARSHANAVMVRAVYEAGENAPVWLSVRDEQGRDLSQPEDRDLLRDLSLASGLRNGLNVDAMRWGFAGETGLPWEE